MKDHWTPNMVKMLADMWRRRQEGTAYRKVFCNEFITAYSLRTRGMVEIVPGSDGRAFRLTERGVRKAIELNANAG